MPRLVVTALTLLGLLLLSGKFATAATIRGTSGADRLIGTPSADDVFGRAGGDRLDGRAGRDLLHGGSGQDRIAAGPGDDRVAVQLDGARDSVACGGGRDIVTADADDRVSGDCEVVSRGISGDPYTNPDSQHETQVEPDSFASGSTIVTTFQSGRYFAGGASNIGWATSTNGGRTWTSGFLPGLSIFSTPAGAAAAVSDPVVAYDAAHGVWLIASLGVSPAVSTLLISRSRDGLNWDLPVVAARAVTAFLAYDKEWIACDNWPSSPLQGRCYLSFTDLTSRGLSTQQSSDGGLTWSAPARGPDLPLSGVQPVSLPNGDLVVVYLSESGIAAVRSRNGGASFQIPTTVSPLAERPVPRFRAPPLPSVEVDGNGRIYVAWQDCRFRPGCTGNDIVLSSSNDGVIWAPATRVPIDSARSPATHVIPGLGVDPRAGGSTRIAIAYHSLPAADCTSACRVDVGLISSVDGGTTWTPAQRLTAQSMPFSWMADTSAGRMLGDYISTSFVAGRPVPVFSLASEPTRSGRFKQATFATIPR